MLYIYLNTSLYFSLMFTKCKFLEWLLILKFKLTWVLKAIQNYFPTYILIKILSSLKIISFSSIILIRS